MLDLVEQRFIMIGGAPARMNTPRAGSDREKSDEWTFADLARQWPIEKLTTPLGIGELIQSDARNQSPSWEIHDDAGLFLVNRGRG